MSQVMDRSAESAAGTTARPERHQRWAHQRWLSHLGLLLATVGLLASVHRLFSGAPAELPPLLGLRADVVVAGLFAALGLVDVPPVLGSRDDAAADLDLGDVTAAVLVLLGAAAAGWAATSVLLGAPAPLGPATALVPALLATAAGVRSRAAAPTDGQDDELVDDEGDGSSIFRRAAVEAHRAGDHEDQDPQYSSGAQRVAGAVLLVLLVAGVVAAALVRLPAYTTSEGTVVRDVEGAPGPAVVTAYPSGLDPTPARGTRLSLLDEAGTQIGTTRLARLLPPMDGAEVTDRFGLTPADDDAGRRWRVGVAPLERTRSGDDPQGLSVQVTTRAGSRSLASVVTDGGVVVWEPQS